MNACAASGSLSGYGAHFWLARNTYQAPHSVRSRPIPNPSATIATDADSTVGQACR